MMTSMTPRDKMLEVGNNPQGWDLISQEAPDHPKLSQS